MELKKAFTYITNLNRLLETRPASLHQTGTRAKILKSEVIPGLGGNDPDLEEFKILSTLEFLLSENELTKALKLIKWRK